MVDWSPQSPDFNILEAVWVQLDREQSKKELSMSLKLAENLPKIIMAVLKNKDVDIN